MDSEWNTYQATGTRKCKCRYCTAGCFHGSRGLASAYQRQPLLNNSATARQRQPLLNSSATARQPLLNSSATARQPQPLLNSSATARQPQPLLNSSATARQPLLDSSASVRQRQSLPYIQTKKKVSVSVKKNRELQTDQEPSIEPDWAKRQAEKIRAWRQAEKIRAWRQALKKEAGQAVSGEQTESRTNEGTGLAPSGLQEEAKAMEDTGMTPSGDQPEAMSVEHPNQAQNHDPGETHHSPLGCQMPDNAGDVDLSSSGVPGESESGNTTEARAELSTGTEPEHQELVPPIEKKTVRMKRVLCVPTNKTWALEQAARIKAWREAKNQEVTLAPSSVSANATTVDVENLPMIQAP